jgi:hypothetical protein
MAFSMVDATFNNFLNETFFISDWQRGFLELPRELPGFLVVFFAALFFFLCSRRLAFLANLLCAFGILLIGFASPGFSVMLIWLFIFSIGQHLFIPLNQSIGMELAHEGQKGRLRGAGVEPDRRAQGHRPQNCGHRVAPGYHRPRPLRERLLRPAIAA